MKTIKHMIFIVLFAVTAIMFTGCDNIIKTDYENMKFAKNNKNMLCGNFIYGNPSKIEFKNRTYVMTDEKVDNKYLNARAGIITRNKSKGIYLWVYSIKDKDVNNEVAVYIDSVFYRAEAQK